MEGSRSKAGTENSWDKAKQGEQNRVGGKKDNNNMKQQRKDK